MGVPQLKWKKNFRTGEYTYGAEVIDNINDDYYEFKTAVLRGENMGLLA